MVEARGARTAPVTQTSLQMSVPVAEGFPSLRSAFPQPAPLPYPPGTAAVPAQRPLHKLHRFEKGKIEDTQDCLDGDYRTNEIAGTGIIVDFGGEVPLASSPLGMKRLLCLLLCVASFLLPVFRVFY